MAYGDADGGADHSAWRNFEKVADIPAATTSYTVSAPTGWGTSVTALRFFMVDVLDLPYDSEMAYLPSSGSGNDYADTGYVPSSNTKVELDITYHTHGSSSSAWIYIFGERYALGTLRDAFCLYMNASGLQMSMGFAALDTGGFSTGLSGVGERIRIRAGTEDVDGTSVLKVYGNDDTTPLYTRNNPGSFTSSHGRTLLVFAAREGSSVGNRHPRADLYCLKIWEGATLERDYTPCIANGVAGLWDNVHGTFIGSATATAFSQGPVTRVNGTFNAVEAAPLTVFATALPVVAVLPSVTAAPDGTATIPYVLSATGEGAATADVSYRLGTSPDALGAPVLAQASASPGLGAFTLSGLQPSTAYYVSMSATSTAGTSAPQDPTPFLTPKAGAASRTIGIIATNRTSGAVSSFDVAVSAANETNLLYMAYGDEDGGATMGAWDETVCLGEVAPYAFATNCVMPEGWGAEVFAMRFFLARGAAATDCTDSFSLLSGPYAVPAGATANGYTAATISWNLVSTGSAATADVAVLYGTAIDNLPFRAALETGASPGAGSATLGGLTAGRTYFARLVASNGAADGEPSPLFSFEVPLPDSPAGGETRPFTGVEVSGGTATARFATSGVATPLYAAYGPEYGGETTNGWAHVVKVADIAPSATSQTFALPAGWGASVKFLRFFMLVDMDAIGGEFLEYIEAFGAQYVNTGIYPDSNLVVKATLSTTDTTHSKILFGEYKSTNQDFNFGCYLEKNPGTTTRALMGRYNDWFIRKDTGKVAGEKWTLTLGMSVGSLADDTQMNGSAGYYSSGGTAAVSSQPLILLNYLSDGNIRNYGYYGRLYGFKAYSEGRLIQNLVPYAKDGVTNLFDIVTATVFENIGTGAFGGGGTAAVSAISWSDIVVAPDTSLPAVDGVSASGEWRGDRVTISGTLVSEGAGDCTIAVETSRLGDFSDAVQWPCAGTYSADDVFSVELYSADTASAAYIRPGEAVWYRVRATDAASQSDYSAPATVTPYAALVPGEATMTSAAAAFTATIPIAETGANTGHVWVVYGMAADALEAATEKVAVPHDFPDASVTVSGLAPSQGTLYWAVVASNDCSTAVWTSTGPVKTRSITNNVRYTWRKPVADGIWEDAANWDAPEGRYDYPTAVSDAYFLNGTTARVAIATSAVTVRQLYVYERNVDLVFHGGSGGTNHSLKVSENMFADATGGTICISNLSFEVTRGGVVINENRLLKFCGGARVGFYNNGILRAGGGPGRHIEISDGTYLEGSGQVCVGGAGSTVVFDDCRVRMYVQYQGFFLSSGADGGEFIIRGRNPRLESVTYFRSSMDRRAGGTITFVIPEGGYAQTPIMHTPRIDNNQYDDSRPFAGDVSASQGRVQPMTIRIDPDSPGLQSGRTLRQPLVSWMGGLSLEKMVVETPSVRPRSNRFAYAAEFDETNGPYGWETSWTDEESPRTLGFIHEHAATVIMVR